MKLVAQILTGSLFFIEVEDNATVCDLKREIGKQENLPSHRLILLLDGADDEERSSMGKDEAPLKDYGVKDGSHIYIFFQPVDTVASPSTPMESASSVPSNNIASFASPSTPKESASGEPSNSIDSSSGPAYNKDRDEVNEDEPPHQENPSDEANVPSASVENDIRHC